MDKMIEDTQILSPEPYQNAFEKFENAIFIDLALNK